MKRIIAIILCVVILISAAPLCAYGVGEDMTAVRLGCQYLLGFDINETVLDGYYIDGEFYVAPGVIAALTGQNVSLSNKDVSATFSKPERKSYVYKIYLEEGKLLRLFQHEKEWPVSVKKLPNGNYLLNFEQTLKAMGARLSFSEEGASYPVSVVCPYSTFDAWADFVTAKKDSLLFDWSEIEKDQGTIDVGALGVRSGLNSLYLDYSDHLLSDAFVAWWAGSASLSATEQQFMDTLSEILLCLSEDRISLEDDMVFSTLKLQIDVTDLTTQFLQLIDVDKETTDGSAFVGKVNSVLGKAITVIEALDTYLQYKNVHESERHMLDALFVSFPLYSQSKDASFRHIYYAADHLNQSIQNGLGVVTMDTVVKLLMDTAGDAISDVSPIFGLIKATTALTKIIAPSLVEANKKINIGCNAWALLMLSSYNYNHWMDRLYSSDFSDEEALSQIKWVMLFQILASITARRSFIDTDTLSASTVQEMQRKNTSLIQLYLQIVESTPVSAPDDNSSTIQWNGYAGEAIDLTALVTDAYSEESSERKLHVPKINLDSNAVDSINAELWETLYDGMIQNPDEDLGTITYSWYVNGSILSLVVECRPNDPWWSYYVYNVDITTGEKVSRDALLKSRGLSLEKYYDQADLALGSVFWKLWNPTAEDLQNSWFNESLQNTVSTKNIDRGSPYLNDKGELCIVAAIYEPAGAAYSWYDVNLTNFTVSQEYADYVGATVPNGEADPKNTPDVSALKYTMRTETVNFYLSNGMLYYKNTVQYPYFEGTSKVETALNRRYAEMLANYKRNDTDWDEEYREYGAEESALPYYDDLYAEVVYQDRDAVSIKETALIWSGGAHPYHYIDCVTYEYSTGRLLSYSDILKGTPEQIDRVLAKYFKQELWTPSDYEIESLKMYTGYALCKKGLCFYYNVGDSVEEAEIVIPYTSNDSYVIDVKSLL